MMEINRLYTNMYVCTLISVTNSLGELINNTIDYRGVRSAPGLETLNHLDPSVPRPQTVRLIGGNRY